jgi:hypothetical protein
MKDYANRTQSVLRRPARFIDGPLPTSPSHYYAREVGKAGCGQTLHASPPPYEAIEPRKPLCKRCRKHDRHYYEA